MTARDLAQCTIAGAFFGICALAGYLTAGILYFG
jgi:hypothetical protein